MLDACIGEQDVQPSEFALRIGHHVGDLVWQKHVGAMIANLDAMIGGDPGAESLDLGRIA